MGADGCYKISSAKVEVWHASPEGKYSSLKEDDGSDDLPSNCRGTYQEGASFTISTNVPGSYGLLNGLSPFNFDFPPYGPKVVHFLVTAPGFKPLVTQVRLDATPDFRGPALVLGNDNSLTLSDQVESNSGISGRVKFVLEPDDPKNIEEGDNDGGPSFCQSSLPRFLNPYAFFTEPLAICSSLPLYFNI